MEKMMNSSKKNVENKGFKKCKNHLMKGKGAAKTARTYLTLC